jgi:ABC-type nitrate/sulfonate/bicarbonate transport system substrate-binding protein
MITRRKVTRVVCSLALCIAALPTSAQQLQEIQFGLPSTSLAGSFMRLAEPLGIFKKHGFVPRFIVMDSGNTATSALISGSVTAIQGGTSEALFAKIRGQNIVILANNYAGYGATLVLSKARADKLGVSPTASVSERLKALDGLLIASPSATSDYTFGYKGAAKAQGADIRFTYMAQTAMPAALESGAVDGYIASAPNWVPPVLKGSAVVWISGPKREVPYEFTPASSVNLQMKRETAMAEPELAERLRAVATDLVEAISERPAEVRTAINTYFPNLSPAALDIIYDSEAGAWKAPPMTIKDVEHDAAFLKSTGAHLDGLDRIDLKTLLYP